ncbi:MAG: hypothetical protein MJ223_01205 [Mycoplasmoidaceae bacterium]|nr:hypothetical protein [Mycoplasmoidaceae bacterium]
MFACAIIGVIAFLIVNYFTNKYMASKPYAVDVFFGYKKIDSINAPAKQLLKENLDTFNKQKEQEQDFVEVEEDK